MCRRAAYRQRCDYQIQSPNLSIRNLYWEFVLLYHIFSITSSYILAQAAVSQPESATVPIPKESWNGTALILFDNTVYIYYNYGEKVLIFSIVKDFFNEMFQL